MCFIVIFILFSFVFFDLFGVVCLRSGGLPAFFFLVSNEANSTAGWLKPSLQRQRFASESLEAKIATGNASSRRTTNSWSKEPNLNLRGGFKEGTWTLG